MELTLFDINQRIADCNGRSVRTYLDRQNLEINRQQLNLQISRTEQELLILDGELLALNKLRAELVAGIESDAK